MVYWQATGILVNLEEKVPTTCEFFTKAGKTENKFEE
jgi:hypothetical protein